ncbi:MAG: hypothetical protein AAF561_13270 [Planctomycetota bacterium]
MQRDQVYDVLFDALLELREAGSESGDKRVFHLADLLHQLPNWLKELDRGEISADDVVERLKSRAGDRGLSAWLDAKLPDVSKAHAEAA